MKTLKRLAAKAVTASLLLFAASCTSGSRPGQLTVLAGQDGTYEIYRISRESPFQFVSEQAGSFNKPMDLVPGSYLVLADCSSETVIIYPGQMQTLSTHRVTFVPPRQPGPGDSFSVHCSRSEKTRSRQQISGRYSLQLLSGKHDLLIGMVPVRVDFSGASNQEMREITWKLSAIKVDFGNPDLIDQSVFISPVTEVIAATKYQNFGSWEFVLPGQYNLEVNGTRTVIDLGEGEERVINPALLRIKTPEGVDLSEPARITGSPWLVEIDSGHFINFNEIYPVLPGSINLSINGSSQSITVNLQEGQTTEIPVRSIKINRKCPQDSDWCRSVRAVALFKGESTYPFLESFSDIPLLYFDEPEMSLRIGIEGSRDITVEQADAAPSAELALGYVRLIPVPIHRPGQLTDLVRVEGEGERVKGHSLDVNLERETLMPLIRGTYSLAHFASSTQQEGDRRANRRSLVVEAGQIQDVDFQVYFSEKRYQQWLKRQKQEATEANSRADSGPFAPAGKSVPF